MNPNEFGKKLGIGLRVASRIAQQRVQQNAANSAAAPQPGPAVPNAGSHPASAPRPTYHAAAGQSIPGHASPGHAAPGAASSARIPAQPPPRPSPLQPNFDTRDLGRKTHTLTRAAGRGLGGFLRPFGRVGGLLWLEITGFFFGLFAIWFASNVWRTRLSYAHGTDHTWFLTSVGLTAVFAYLSISAFWRARRK